MAVVPVGHTVPYPRAMMVHPEPTDSAPPAMMCTNWPRPGAFLAPVLLGRGSGKVGRNGAGLCPARHYKAPFGHDPEEIEEDQAGDEAARPEGCLDPGTEYDQIGANAEPGN